MGYRHSARFLAPFIRVLRRHPEIPRDTITTLEAIDVDEWIPYARSSRFCEWAVGRIGDEDLGLHAAESMQPGDLDVLEFAARSCSDFAVAIDVVNRYISLLREGAAFELEQVGDQCIWHFHMDVKTPRVINDWTVAVYVLLGRAMAPEERALHTEVHVTHERPHDTREYERILRLPVRFGQACNRLVFPSRALALPIAGASPQLHAVMRRYAGELLQRRPQRHLFSERVREAVVETLGGHQSGTDAVARKLHMSGRTLGRRLQQEGTSFMVIYDDVRRELALRYLEQPQLNIAEVAFMLGFSQTPAFSRAFKRWTGASPIEHRRHRRMLRSVS